MGRLVWMAWWAGVVWCVVMLIWTDFWRTFGLKRDNYLIYKHLGQSKPEASQSKL